MELYRKLDNNLNKISQSIEVKQPHKAVFIKEKYIIQQKILNQLIDIYQTKAKYYSPKKIIRDKSTLPHIKKRYPLSPIMSSQRDEAGKSQIQNRDKDPRELSFFSPKIKKVIQRDKLIKLRDSLTKKAKQKAKEQREYMLLLKDNLCLYKDNLRVENTQRKNIVLTKNRIMNESIMNYKQYKRGYIEMMNNCDISQLNKENAYKKNELAYWKRQTEEKMRKSNSMNSYFFMTQHNNKTTSNENNTLCLA